MQHDLLDQIGEQERLIEFYGSSLRGLEADIEGLQRQREALAPAATQVRADAFRVMHRAMGNFQAKILPDETFTEFSCSKVFQKALELCDALFRDVEKLQRHLSASAGGAEDGAGPFAVVDQEALMLHALDRSVAGLFTRALTSTCSRLGAEHGISVEPDRLVLGQSWIDAERAKIHSGLKGSALAALLEATAVLQAFAIATKVYSGALEDRLEAVYRLLEELVEAAAISVGGPPEASQGPSWPRASGMLRCGEEPSYAAAAQSVVAMLEGNLEAGSLLPPAIDQLTARVHEGIKRCSEAVLEASKLVPMTQGELGSKALYRRRPI